MRTSISRTNNILLSSFLILNLSLIAWMSLYALESHILIYLIIIITLSFAMLASYIAINSRYWTEHSRLFQHFQAFIRDKRDPAVMPHDEEFSENAEFLSLFQRTYIENKLLKKDYNDFKKVFDTFIPKEIHSQI